MTGYLLEKQDKIIFSRGEEGLSDTEKIIQDDFVRNVDMACLEAFNSLTDNYYNTGINVSEEEAVELYKKTALEILKKQYADIGTINARIPVLKSGDLTLDDRLKINIDLKNDVATLKGVKVDFTYGTKYADSVDVEASAGLRKIVFYDENTEIFKYAMIAPKGIYITGKTSTIMGNIYAGVHSPSELRKAEALYGETENYGGLNIMTTQLAFYGDKIVSEGDVNMKGAFVIFGSEEQPVSIYAKNVNEMDVLAAKNMYALFGDIKGDSISDDTDKVLEAIENFDDIEKYYDSNNDKTYTGTYRKIISATDVTVRNDVTGIIITPGSVIIEAGVNVEGLIICGDRIYLQGNNNVVSSVEVLRKILREELSGEMYAVDDSETLEEQARNSIHLDMKDYLGGIEYRGMQ